MQREAFLGHIVGRSELACYPVKISAVRAWHEPGLVKQVRQFVGFAGYYRRFIQNLAELSGLCLHFPLRTTGLYWTRMLASLRLEASLISYRETAYASRSFILSQRRHCTSHREMLAAVTMCTHFRSYLRGTQLT